jgi:hypothetical protein
MEVRDRAALEAFVDALKTADTPDPTTYAIHGRVLRSDGRPLPDATVDLLGPYVYINHFTTRDDGTFTMFIQAPPQPGYSLRVRFRRWNENQEVSTPSFSLHPEDRELAVVIRVK